MSQELVKIVGPTEVARLLPSFLVLVQTTSIKRGGGKPGQIFDTATGQLHDKLTVVFHNRNFQRAKYADRETHSDAPICRSLDGKTPDPTLTPFATECRLCPYQFEKYFNGKALVGTGYCKRSLKVGVIAAETKLEHNLDCGGKSENAAFKAWDALDATIKLYAAQGDVAYHEDFQFVVKGVMVKNYAVWGFEGPTLVEDGEVFGPLYSEALARYNVDEGVVPV